MAGLLDALLDPQFRQDTLRGLLDAGNRGAVAGLLGGPVDLATMAMRPFGYGVEKPFGGSEWIGQKMQDAGLVSGNRNPVAEALASFAGPMAAQQAGPKLYAAEQAMRANMAAPTPMNAATRGQAGAIVYHGSPHVFDRFDSSKIGTGEGAQAYGHGLYLAEAPTVAKQYAGDLSAARATQPVGNVDLTQAYQNLATDVPDKLLSSRRDFRALQDAGVLSPSDRKDFLAAVKQNIVGAQGGNMYKVDLPDSAVAKMLDWDKPLSQQPTAVRQHFEPLVAPIRAEMAKPADPGWGQLAAPTKFDPTGQELMGLLRNRDADQTAQTFLANGMGPQVSQTLKARGIPGIRYLDGGSRGAGQGSSNFVVFPGEESLLTILERNGQPLR
jgi:hypothetical protein